jgi:hypothetical protein
MSLLFFPDESRTVTLLEMIKRREKAKRERLQLIIGDLRDFDIPLVRFFETLLFESLSKGMKTVASSWMTSNFERKDLSDLS